MTLVQNEHYFVQENFPFNTLLYRVVLVCIITKISASCFSPHLFANSTCMANLCLSVISAVKKYFLKGFLKSQFANFIGGFYWEEMNYDLLFDYFGGQSID